MGLFAGQVRKFGEKLAEKFRERALTFHEEAGAAMSDGKPGMANNKIIVGTVLDTIAETIEAAVTDEDD